MTRFRWVGLLEGTTLATLLLIAMPLKHLAGWRWGVSVIGPLHGAVFLAYLFTLCETAAAENWPWRDVMRAAAACLIPFGTFYNDRWLRRRTGAGA